MNILGLFFVCIFLVGIAFGAYYLITWLHNTKPVSTTFALSTMSSSRISPTMSPSRASPTLIPVNNNGVKGRVFATLNASNKAGADMKFPYVSAGTTDWEYTDSTKWTSGFFPALVLQTMTDGDNTTAIESLLKVLETEKTNAKSHDVGFKVFLPFRIAMDKLPVNKDKYKNIIFTAAATLASLFDPAIGMTRSWTTTTYGKFPVIVDNLMNLELLLWAGQNKPEPRWTQMATSHLSKTMKDFVQPGTDGCVYHRISYNSDGTIAERSGLPQGFSDKSSVWTRGLAWTIYGYTMAYRYTKNKDYLAFAEKVLKCYMANVGADNVPVFDYKATGAAASIKDSSAAAIVASALAELHTFVPGGGYKDKAKAIIASLQSKYWSSKGPFLLVHVCDHFQKGTTDVSAIYADYYYVEAVKRLALID